MTLCYSKTRCVHVWSLKKDLEICRLASWHKKATRTRAYTEFPTQNPTKGVDSHRKLNLCLLSLKRLCCGIGDSSLSQGTSCWASKLAHTTLHSCNIQVLTRVGSRIWNRGVPKCTRKRTKVFFSTFKSTTRFGHLRIVTLSSQLASTSMRWLKIIILGLFVATAVNIEAFLMQEQGDCSPLTL